MPRPDHGCVHRGLPAFAFLTLLLASCQTTPPPTARVTPLSHQLANRAANRPLRVAHRGDSYTHPENTLPAFTAALESGAEMVELDFRQTRDGILVCFHDETLDRTTDARHAWNTANLRLKDQTHGHLQMLCAGTWKGTRFGGTRIPTLEQALAAIHPRSMAMIEHKAGDAEALLKVLRRHDLVNKVVVQSFHWAWLERLHQLEPRLTLAALGGLKADASLDPATLRAIARTGASLVHWHASKLDPANVERLRRLGYLVCAYTVNDQTEWHRLRRLGVHAITTDTVWRWPPSTAGE